VGGGIPAAGVSLQRHDVRSQDFRRDRSRVSDSDDDADFSGAFCAFLQSCVDSVNAAELLLFLWRKPAVAWSVHELAAAIDPVGSLSEAEASRYLDTFAARGLITRKADGRVSYKFSADSEVHVETLARLYLERPVTLFRVIYALRDTKIKTLADAFRIWRT
jgi:hypothetical protein